MFRTPSIPLQGEERCADERVSGFYIPPFVASLLVASVSGGQLRLAMIDLRLVFRFPYYMCKCCAFLCVFCSGSFI